MRTLAWLWVVLLLLVNSACTISMGNRLGPADDGSGGGNIGSEDPTTSILPEPEQWLIDPPALTPEQQKKQQEADRYIAQTLYKGYTIVRTVQGDSGDIIDWIASDTLPELPYSLPELSWSLEQLALPEGVELAVSELEKFPELRGPIGSTPFHRPTFWGYVLEETDATSIQDYLDRYQVSGQPAGEHRLYAGLLLDEPNRGISGYMNQFQPKVELYSFSFMEFAVGCPAPAAGPLQELVGIVISVDKANGFDRGNVLTDGKPRLHVEYIRQKNGKNEIVWDLPGFVPNPLSHHTVGSVVPVSTPGGMQVEHRVDLVQWGNGDWWIVYNGDFLGYYPASLFTLLNQGACYGGWYTEVLDQTSGDGWVKTEIGPGKFANAGLLQVPWVRQPKYRDLGWVEHDPRDDQHMSPEKKECYTRSDLLDLGGLWGKLFFAGGPGGNSPECKKP